jgi:hypothetical protein
MRSQVLQLLAALIAVSVGSSATAAVITSSSSAITQYVSYTTYDSGDVTFSLANSGIAGCSNGFWIGGTDAGAKAVIAQVLSAYRTGTPIVVYADPTQLWPGSGGQYCHIWGVQDGS